VTSYLGPPGNSPGTPLYCFHHAGGGSSLFQNWDRALTPLAAVMPVLLPGRERRAREPRFVSIDALVADLDTELGPFLSMPGGHIFFGHSMGALVAYRLARHRHAAGKALPRALLLSAFSAPHLPSPFAAVDSLDDNQLAQMMEGVGGLPVDLPAQWRADLLAVARDDLRVCDSYADAGEPPLPCPIHVFGGDDDPLVTPDDLRAWDEHSTEPVDVHILRGDHFYLRDTPEPLLAELRPILRRYVERRPARWESTVW
jgi:surfactin synthase thioesterase subunit